MTKTVLIVSVVALAIALAVIFVKPPEDLTAYEDQEFVVIRGRQLVQFAGLIVGGDGGYDTLVLEFDLNYEVLRDDIWRVMEHDLSDMPGIVGEVIMPHSVTLIFRGYDMR